MHGKAAKKTTPAEAPKAVPRDEETVYLFTTKTCPNCRLAKSFLDKAGVAYRVVDAEENRELVENFGVRQAPTLIVVQGENVLAFRQCLQHQEICGRTCLKSNDFLVQGES